jgi:GT2 family glycosyltransferase
MDEEKDKVTVVILCYNTLSKLGKTFFQKVLESVFSQDYRNLEVLLVDNGSNDETPSYLKNLPNIQNCKILCLQKNRGWAGGNNVAINSVSPGEFLFFMNDDVILIDPSCIRKLVKVLTKYENIGALQPLIRNADGTFNCGFDVSLSGLPVAVFMPKNYPLSEAFYASGAALFTRSKIFNKLGMFDEDLFLYHDDLDYGWRSRLAGLRVACLVNTSVYHYGSATLGSGNPLLLYFVIRNSIWVLAKNSTLTWFIIRLFFFFFEALMSFLAYLLRHDYKKAVTMLKALLDGLKGLRIPFSKRANIMGIRKVRETEINRYMHISAWGARLCARALLS